MMTTMNEHALKDLRKYMKATIWSAIFLISLLVLTFFAAYFFNAKPVVATTIGALVGVAFATINLFAIGYAFFVIAIKDGQKLALLAPLASFLAMAIFALFLTKLTIAYIFGFALGLTAPILFASSLVRMTGTH